MERLAGAGCPIGGHADIDRALDLLFSFPSVRAGEVAISSVNRRWSPAPLAIAKQAPVGSQHGELGSFERCNGTGSAHRKIEREQPIVRRNLLEERRMIQFAVCRRTHSRPRSPVDGDGRAILRLPVPGECIFERVGGGVIGLSGEPASEAPEENNTMKSSGTADRA